MNYVEWFCFYRIALICNGDFNTFRDTITLEECEQYYNKLFVVANDRKNKISFKYYTEIVAIG